MPYCRFLRVFYITLFYEIEWCYREVLLFVYLLPYYNKNRTNNGQTQDVCDTNQGYSNIIRILLNSKKC